MSGTIQIMRFPTILLVALVAVLVTASGTASAGTPVILDSDDFEYDDSLSNHGWVIEDGDPHTVTDPENPGNRVVLLLSSGGSSPFFRRDFNELPLEPGMRLSIRFYDTGDNCGNCNVHVKLHLDGDSKEFEAGWYNNAASFEYSHTFSGVFSGHLYETFNLRSVGWHTFEWVVDQNGGIDLLIDGNLIVDDLMGPNNIPAATLTNLEIGAGSDPFAYSFSVDDFLFETDGVPPPERTLVYYGLGDSIASGHGLPGASEFCKRAPGAYPELVAQLLQSDPGITDQYQVIDIVHLACSGTGSKKMNDDEYSFQDQISDVLTDISNRRDDNPDTDVLISITIGANNFEFVAEILSFGQNFCKNTKAFDNWVIKNMRQVQRDLTNAINDLLSAEGVYIILTDYHNPFNELSFFLNLILNNRHCKQFVKGLPPDLQIANLYQRTETAVHGLNLGIMQVGEADSFPPGRIAGISVHQSFHGHESSSLTCGLAPPSEVDTWVQLFPDCFHPNETGAQEYANDVAQVALELLFPVEP